MSNPNLPQNIILSKLAKRYHSRENNQAKKERDKKLLADNQKRLARIAFETSYAIPTLWCKSSRNVNRQLNKLACRIGN